MAKLSILAIDDDAASLELVMSALEQSGAEILSASDPEEGMALFRDHHPEIVLVDLQMPKMSGLEVLRQIVQPESDGDRNKVQTIVIVLTAFASAQTAVEAMKAGAYDYLEKPIRIPELRLVIERAIEKVQLRSEVWRLRRVLNAKYGFDSIVGNAQPLLAALDIAARAAQTSATVLIRGETGTGKELVARAIHFNSARKNRPFVTINCGAIPKDLLESELFGHFKGSFTGAVTHKSGKVETADGGSLFLDEIGDMPLDLQVKLLRLVQHGEIEKIGASGPTKVDVRIIAATHRNLKAMLEDRTFREDLYYRLSVVPLQLPPLRERPGDIPELVRHFFRSACEKNGRTNLRLPEALMPYFTDYAWPGNVRELENSMESVVVLADGDVVRLGDVPDFLRVEPERKNLLGIRLPAEGISIEEVEKELIVTALGKFDWNQSRAAQYLGLSRKTLIYRMGKFGLRRGPDDRSLTASTKD